MGADRYYPSLLKAVSSLCLILTWEHGNHCYNGSYCKPRKRSTHRSASEAQQGRKDRRSTPQESQVWGRKHFVAAGGGTRRTISQRSQTRTREQIPRGNRESGKDQRSSGAKESNCS